MTASTMLGISSDLLRSSGTMCILSRAAAEASAFVASNASTRRELKMTLAPRSAHRNAVALPIPLLAPVIQTT
jgi:hypothetical protein